MRNKQIAIVTIANDLHGPVIQQAIQANNQAICHLVDVDCICDNSPLTWSNSKSANITSTVPSRSGVAVEVGNLDLIWWRRTNYPQRLPSDVVDEFQIDLINNDSQASLFGLLKNEFKGVWINDPMATRMAENKLIQLRAAELAGFQVPQTLISNDPEVVNSFCMMLDYQVVVKPVRGTQKYHLFTRKLRAEHLEYDDSVRLSPAMYQQYIPGSSHIRAHCFGDKIYAVAIESADLDWREDLDVPFDFVKLSEQAESRLRDALAILGLRMGIVDLKMNGSEPVWLEINPQGQFLFAEGLSGFDLTGAFVDFLLSEASSPPMLS